MEERLAGEYVTHETRGLSHEKVDKKKRYSQQNSWKRSKSPQKTETRLQG